MTALLICAKEFDRKICGRRFSQLAMEKVCGLGGDMLLCGDSAEEIRSAAGGCTFPLLIFPVNILTDFDLTKLIGECRDADMAVLLPRKGQSTGGCIAVLDRLPERDFTSKELFIAAAAERFRIKAVYADRYYAHITDRESYLAALGSILRREYQPDKPFDKSEFAPELPASKDFEGEYPLFMGENCVIGENVRISAGSYIGSGVYIGAGTRIMGSAVMDGAYISGGCVIEHSIIMENTAVNKGRQLRCSVVSGRDEKTSPRKRRPVFGTDGVMGSELTAADIFAAGRAAAELNTAAAFHENSSELADVFFAGAASAGGSIASYGAMPENIFRYALKCAGDGSEYGCGIYFGDGCMRAWGGDGLPSEEGLRKLLESPLENSFSDISRGMGAICKNNAEIYKSYNNYLDKLTVSDVRGIFADITTPDRALGEVCNEYARRHGLLCRDNTRIAFHISGDGGRISAYTDETGYLFHDKLIMLCLYWGSGAGTVYSTFPHVRLRRGDGREVKLRRIEYAPDYKHMSEAQKNADLKARREASPLYFDGAAIMAAVLNILGEKQMSLQQAADPLPEFSSANRMVSSEENAEDIFRRLGMPPLGGKAAADSGSVYLRPLRTGGIVIAAESSSLEAASELCSFYEEKALGKNRKVTG